MDSQNNIPKNIDEYISTFPSETQEKLSAVRETIKNAAPEATEKISYWMPTFYFNWNLVHFAAFKNHIWFYPAPSWIIEFNKELSKYISWKWSVQFPLDKDIPYELIKKIVEYRMIENINKNSKK